MIYGNPGFGFKVTPAAIPSSFGIKLESQALNYIIPGLVPTYGEHREITIKVELLKAENYRSWENRN
jgi:hypothetical protein